MVHYRDDAMKPLKVEVSYRQADQIDEADVTVIDGIRTYTIDKLAFLKIDALVGRTKARDIFDTSYLLAPGTRRPSPTPIYSASTNSLTSSASTTWRRSCSTMTSSNAST